MIKELSITRRQAEMLAGAQGRINAAQSALDMICAVVTAGHDVEGKVVALNLEALTINVEVPDIAPEETKEAA